MLDIPHIDILKIEIMNSSHIKISNNLSEVWLDVFQHIVDGSGTELTPLVISLTGSEEHPKIRGILNSSLLHAGLDTIDTVSETIFPQSLYSFERKDRQKLYENYLNKVLPRLKKIDQRNASGTYFERMISYGEADVNQLEIVINSLIANNVKRRSKLQISIFDPLRDHKPGMFQGFPCLQHVTFYKSESGGLIINSFYAIQYFYQRAYGNWLGLINLGKFVAEQVNISFEGFNCFVGVEKMDHLTKTIAKEIITKMKMTE